MRRENQSGVSEFLLLGLPMWPEQQSMFFGLILGMIMGNLLIILLIRLDSHFHTPVYFFISHLAIIDVSLLSIMVPKMLMNMKTQDKSAPYAGCISQMYFFFSIFGDIDNFLLTMMAYDRDVAICQTLCYRTNHEV